MWKAQAVAIAAAVSRRSGASPRRGAQGLCGRRDDRNRIEDRRRFFASTAVTGSSSSPNDRRPGEQAKAGKRPICCRDGSCDRWPAKDGALAQGSRTELVRALVGVGVKAGAASPDLSSVDAFKQSLLAAKTVSYVDPKAGGTSGTYFEGLLARMGIAEQMKPKIVYRTQGAGVADAVHGRGRARDHVHRRAVAEQGRENRRAAAQRDSTADELCRCRTNGQRQPGCRARLHPGDDRPRRPGRIQGRRPSALDGSTVTVDRDSYAGCTTRGAAALGGQDAEGFDRCRSGGLGTVQAGAVELKLLWGRHGEPFQSRSAYEKKSGNIRP